MGTRRLVTLLFLAGAAVAGCSDEQAKIDGSGYSYSLPDGWEDGIEAISEVEDETGILADSVAFGEREDDFTTNVNVFREGGLPARMTAAKYAEISIAGLREPDASGIPPDIAEQVEAAAATDISEARPGELGGEDAVGWEYRSKGPEREMRVRQVAAVKDGAAYTVTLTALPEAYDEGSDALDEVVDSWEWE